MLKSLQQVSAFLASFLYLLECVARSCARLVLKLCQVYGCTVLEHLYSRVNQGAGTVMPFSREAGQLIRQQLISSEPGTYAFAGFHEEQSMVYLEVDLLRRQEQTIKLATEPQQMQLDLQGAQAHIRSLEAQVEAGQQKHKVCAEAMFIDAVQSLLCISGADVCRQTKLGTAFGCMRCESAATCSAG